MADNNSTAGYSRPNTSYGSGNTAYNSQYGSRSQPPQGYGMHPTSAAADLAALSQNFQGVNLQNPSFVAQAKTPMMSTAAGNYGTVAVAGPMPPSMYGGNAGFVFPNTYAASASTQSPTMYTPQASPYMSQLGYSSYPHHDNSPMSSNWTPTTANNSEVPRLVTPRRDSVSSNENEQPATPYGAYAGLAQSGVAINRSPSGAFTHSTPSPTSLIGTYSIGIPKQPDQSDVSPRIKMLVSQEPAIPHAIPAPSSPLKPLDRALENQRGETNVYIRGLLPETTDEMLLAWGSRFGDIKSSKSIIDLNTGSCKGFGFVKYHNYVDAENCIRGFHFLGYEESFYSKLKAFADEANTNLYVSNLPKNMNEHQLAELFKPHTVCSSRILRDKNGHGRGVGFARFESRDACEEVIKLFNNRTVPSEDEDVQIQIRYADTQEQKNLKQQTQAARQFRSAEYEIATQVWRHGRPPYCGSTSQDNEFEQYLGTGPGVPIQGQRWAQSAVRPGPGRSPLSNSTNFIGPVQTIAQITVSPGDDACGAAVPDSAADSKTPVHTPATVQGNSPVDSAAPSEQE